MRRLREQEVGTKHQTGRARRERGGSLMLVTMLGALSGVRSGQSARRRERQRLWDDGRRRCVRALCCSVPGEDGRCLAQLTECTYLQPDVQLATIAQVCHSFNCL
jgi:hypothetical protein